MDNSYAYAPSYDYSFAYTSPTSSSSYYYSPTVPSCPYHSSYAFYTSSPSVMNLSTPAYSYYEQLQPAPVITPPTHAVYSSTTKTIDRTPLRSHRCFKKNELQILHVAFARDPHPPLETLQQLASQLKAPLDKVRQWFKNRRHSEKQKTRTSGRSTQSS